MIDWLDLMHHTEAQQAAGVWVEGFMAQLALHCKEPSQADVHQADTHAQLKSSSGQE